MYIYACTYTYTFVCYYHFVFGFLHVRSYLLLLLFGVTSFCYSLARSFVCALFLSPANRNHEKQKSKLVIAFIQYRARDARARTQARHKKTNANAYVSAVPRERPRERMKRERERERISVSFSLLLYSCCYVILCLVSFFANTIFKLRDTLGTLFESVSLSLLLHAAAV